MPLYMYTRISYIYMCVYVYTYIQFKAVLIFIIGTRTIFGFTLIIRKNTAIIIVITVTIIKLVLDSHLPFIPF